MKALLILIASSTFVLTMLFIMRTIILFSAYLHWMDSNLPHTFMAAYSDLTVLAGTLQLACS